MGASSKCCASSTEILFFCHLFQLSITYMLLHLRIPKTLLWVLNLLIIYTLLFTVFRLMMVIMFKPADESLTDLLPSFLLGFRFDLRWISVVLLPIVLASIVPRLSPYYCSKNKKLWTWYLAIATFF